MRNPVSILYCVEKKNINTFPTHLIFKLVIEFMWLILNPINSIVDIKLCCMEMFKGCMCIIYHVVLWEKYSVSFGSRNRLLKWNAYLCGIVIHLFSRSRILWIIISMRIAISLRRRISIHLKNERNIYS
jgi:hypothetical protein